ncbi:glutaredoxin family protein [Thalassomonas sp. M1454]|uniref:glutaredoxin family protein n=1 Tax=Thalassomonas sp. M1454 TaxID=2594477 RepID=UPI00117E8A47|nr:glutaredoxin family protein [Thalassomonas sp. M1454]TRX56383.1 glutaredoxin family protein [Thalassomonas sp. M1454]
MKRVTLYTKNRCPHCETAKKYLDQQGIKYRLCNTSSPAGLKEFRGTGFRGVPLLKIGDQFLNGFSIKQFQAMYNK